VNTDGQFKNAQISSFKFKKVLKCVDNQTSKEARRKAKTDFTTEARRHGERQNPFHQGGKAIILLNLFLCALVSLWFSLFFYTERNTRPMPCNLYSGINNTFAFN
jgi:hypothetical protein